MLEARLRVDYPKTDRSLSLEERQDLVNRLMEASTELQSLAADEDFRFQSLTGSVARLVHDWCIIVSPDLKESITEAANDVSDKKHG